MKALGFLSSLGCFSGFGGGVAGQALGGLGDLPPLDHLGRRLASMRAEAGRPVPLRLRHAGLVHAEYRPGAGDAARTRSGPTSTGLYLKSPF